MKFTILQFAWGLQLEGMQHVVVSLAKKFKEKAHNAYVCATIQEGELVNELNKNNIPYHFFGLKSSYDFRALIPIMQYLRKNKVDVVITHNYYGSLIPRIASILLRVPVIIHVEHSISDPKKYYHVIIDRALSIFSHKIICVSEAAKRSLIEKEGLKPEKILVIHNGIDTSRYASRKINKDQKTQKIRVGIVARFSEVKGHIYFVKAASIILDKFKNVEFIYLGDGPLKCAIENQVKEYGLDNCSHFLGTRSDVYEILNTLDIFVLPSLYEGLPLSLLEAQSCGIASVVTEVGGNPEVIQDGYNGLLVPPKDSEKLASAIVKLLCNDDFRYSLGINGIKVINEKFSLEKTANAYIDQIHTIINIKNKNNKTCMNIS